MQRRVLTTAAVAVAMTFGVVPASAQPQIQVVPDPAAHVNPFIGTTNLGNTFPGAVVPFGMLAWSPETTRGDHGRVAAPGGYAYDAPRIRGFGLTSVTGDDAKLKALKDFVLPGLASGNFKPSISKVFPFDSIVEAHRYLEAGQQIGKIVVTV